MLRINLFKVLVGLTATTCAWAGALDARINGSVDNSQLQTLNGNVHPLARAEFDRGAAPADLPMDHMLLVLTPSASQEAALQNLLKEQQDPNSAEYHKWLTPQQFGAQFGADDSDVQVVRSWLESEGFTVNGVSNGKTLIDFSGTEGEVQSAFHTQIHEYLVNGEQHWANATNPQIPAALTPVVAGVATLHNFIAKPQLIHSPQTFEAALTAGGKPQYTLGVGNNALSPGDYATIYNLNPLFNAGINGAGRTIAVVGRSNINVSDVAQFRSAFGLPANNPHVIVNGKDPGNLGSDEEAEAVLDTTWAGATAPGATVDLVISRTTNTTDGLDLSETYIVDHNLADVMSESFGDCEANYTQADATHYSSLAQQAAAEGITYFVAAGDSGSAGCNSGGDNTSDGMLSVNILAANPYVVAVGGTEFNENGNYSAYWSSSNSSTGVSALSYIPENVWNESCTIANGVNPCTDGNTPGLWSGGGGASVLYTKPSWQTGVAGIPNDGARDVPDVALTAAGHDPYLICLGGSCAGNGRGGISFQGYAGTSAATPSMAGITATILQQVGSRLGLINTSLYQFASSESLGPCNASNTATLPGSTCIFNDVTVGNNSVPGETGYNTSSGKYQATSGYDLASGLGSVNATNLSGYLSGGGVGTPVISASNASLVFGSTRLGYPSTQQITISNTGNGNLVLGQLSVNSAQFSASLGCSTVILPGNSCTINVTFRPTRVGTQSAVLTVPGLRASSAAIALSGTAYATASASVSLVSLDFGTQKVVTRSTAQTVSIVNSTSQPLDASTIGISGANPEDYVEGNNCPQSIPPGSTCAIYVVFAPLFAGTRTATVSVPVTAGSQTTVDVTGTATINGNFEIYNAKTGKVLEVAGASASNGALVQQNALDGNPEQQWQLVSNPDGSYTFVNAKSGLVMDVTGASTTDGTLIQQYQSLDVTNQHWTLTQVDDVHYSILNVNSGKSLDIPEGTTANNTPVQQYDYVGDPQQLWVLLPIGSYNITNQLSADVLDVVGASTSNGAQIQQTTPNGARNEQWLLVPVGGGYWAIMNRYSGGVLDDTGGSDANGNLMQQYEYVGDPNQQWSLIPLDAVGYKIVNRLSGKVLDDTGGSTTSGSLIQQYDYVGGTNQEWILYAATYYYIVNVNSGLVLDVPGGSTANGTNIQQWAMNGNQQQQWQLVPVANGYAAIVNNATGKCLDDTGGSDTPGTLIQQYQFLGDPEQQWKVNLVNGSDYEIQNVNSNNVLDVIGASKSDGTLIQLYTYVAGTNQLWTLVAVGQ